MTTRKRVLLILLISFLGLASSFTSPGASLLRKTVLFSTVPEPGSCPECSDENGYWDGGALFVCVACGHEWSIEAEESVVVDDVTRDANGSVLERGDTVILVKDLGKGLKKGTKVKNIRLGDYGDGHDIEANIPSMGTYLLKSQFLKKV